MIMALEDPAAGSGCGVATHPRHLYKVDADHFRQRVRKGRFPSTLISDDGNPL
jgi:hypothetical protein